MYRLESVLFVCPVHISDVPPGKCSVCVHSTHFWCTAWKVFCLCAQYTFLVYRLQSVLFMCTVHISDVPSGKYSVCVPSTHFWCTVWKVFCLCAQYTFLMYRLESVLFVCTVHISDIPSGNCSVSVHSTHLCCNVWKMFCFCAQYTFLIYRLESVLLVCTVHISDVPSGKCSVCVHSTHFWCTVWKVFCLCAQYTFLMYRLESVLFVCTVHSDAQCWDSSLSNWLSFSVARENVCVFLPPLSLFQSLSNQAAELSFIMNVTDMNYSSYIRRNSTIWRSQLSFRSASQDLNKRRVKFRQTLLCLTDLHPPFISQTLRDGTPQVHKTCFVESSPLCDVTSNFIVTQYTSALYKYIKLSVPTCPPV